MITTIQSHTLNHEFNVEHVTQVVNLVDELNIAVGVADGQVDVDQLSDVPGLIERLAHNTETPAAERSLEAVDALFGLLADDSFFFAT